jgi:hypothetical protein
MNDKPIYINRGDGHFERFSGTLADLQVVGWPDFFPEQLPPGVSSVSAAADHVYYNENVAANLLTMSLPGAEVWESLSRFLEQSRE